MARYAAGSPVRVSTEVRDAAGTLTPPGTILLRVKKPDGTFLADYTTPTLDSTGKYHQDIPAADVATIGHYAYAWITSGAAAGVSPSAAFEVVDPFTATHITYQDARDRLNTSATSDSEVQAFIVAAVSAQEQRVGPVAPRTVTESLYAHYGRLALSTRPVMSVTSATLNGVAVSTTAWLVPSAMAGLVDLGSGAWWGSGGPSFSGQLYSVTYTAGRNPVPQDLVEAALLRVMHAEATQRGGSGGGQVIGSASSDIATGVDSSDFLLMLRAQDLEKPYVLPSVA